MVKGRGQRAFMQKGCILTSLGFSMRARVKSRFGECYMSIKRYPWLVFGSINALMFSPKMSKAFTAISKAAPGSTPNHQ